METKMNVCNQGEADFFLSHLQPHHRVLEYGSGGSTLEIAKRVNKLVSIEHDATWFKKMITEVPNNVTLFFEPPTQDLIPGDDGSRVEFSNYVDIPLNEVEKEGPFDIIFIDGRARVACAEICSKLGHSNTLVFIHDYNHPNPEYLRTEYFDAERFLTRVDGHFTMYKFLITELQKPATEEPGVDENALNETPDPGPPPSPEPPLPSKEKVKKKDFSEGGSPSEKNAPLKKKNPDPVKKTAKQRGKKK